MEQDPGTGSSHMQNGTAPSFTKLCCQPTTSLLSLSVCIECSSVSLVTAVFRQMSRPGYRRTVRHVSTNHTLFSTYQNTQGTSRHPTKTLQVC